MATPKAPKDGQPGRRGGPPDDPAFESDTQRRRQDQRGQLTLLAVFSDHLDRAVKDNPTFFRYLIILIAVVAGCWLLLHPYLAYVHEIVSMLLKSPDAPRPLSIVIAVVVLGTPVMLFRPRSSAKAIRALAAFFMSWHGKRPEDKGS